MWQHIAKDYVIKNTLPLVMLHEYNRKAAGFQ